MSKKTAKHKEHVFSEIEIDMDENTRNYLIALGAERFNKLSDEVVEQIMLDYGATIALSESLNIVKKNSEIRFAPIALHDSKKFDDSNFNEVDDSFEEDDYGDKYEEPQKNSALPSIEMDEISESIISAFLEVSREDVDKINNEVDFAWPYKLNASDIRAERIRKYIKMSRAQRRKFLARWIDELVEQWR
jgi:hypothetical protein